MTSSALRTVVLAGLCAVSLLSVSSSHAQDADPSMQDILSDLEKEQAAPAPATPAEPAPNSTIRPALPGHPNPAGDLSRITPDPTADTAIPTGTMVKPAVTDSQPTETVPAQPLENMNPALLPQTPADEAPKAVRAETAPAAPKPPAYDAEPYVMLQTLDKVTARTNTLTVKVGDTVAIGPLFVQVKTCQQAAPLETPDSAAFLQIWEAKPKESALKTVPVGTDDKSPSQWVFSGWMFASSPALSAMDHPIYDIWVLDCKKSATEDAETSAAQKAVPSAAAAPAAEAAETDAEAAPVDTEAAPAGPPDSAASSKSE